MKSELPSMPAAAETEAAASAGKCSSPAAALTAYARDEDRKQALAAGFQMHIAKPIAAGQLVTMIAKLAGREN